MKHSYRVVVKQVLRYYRANVAMFVFSLEDNRHKTDVAKIVADNVLCIGLLLSFYQVGTTSSPETATVTIIIEKDID